MKSLISFLTDSILVIMLLFVMTAAFLATYALSPIAFEKSSLAKNDYDVSNILGDNQNLGFEIVNMQQNQNVEIQRNNESGDEVIRIKISNIAKGENAYHLFDIHSYSSKIVSIPSYISTPLDEAKGIELSISSRLTL